MLLLLGGAILAAVMLHSMRRENAMMLTDTRVAIPSIDAAAPVETKTATFALG